MCRCAILSGIASSKSHALPSLFPNADRKTSGSANTSSADPCHKTPDSINSAFPPDPRSCHKGRSGLLICRISACNRHEQSPFFWRAVHSTQSHSKQILEELMVQVQRLPLTVYYLQGNQ